MIYVVTGHPRSGTSMTMAALEAGGIPAAYSAMRNQRLGLRSDQKSGFNSIGSYELTQCELEQHFPQAFDGHAVKLVWAWLHFLRRYEPGYHVIMLLRDPEEVRQSFEASVSLRLKRTQIAKNYAHNQDAAFQLIKSHPDVTRYNIIEYAKVVAEPVRWFRFLRLSGIPIDADKAASIVDPNLYRFRRELLVEGA